MRLSAILVLALVLAGCGASPRYETRRPDPVSALVIGTTLPGTEVWVDGTLRGKSGTKALEIPVPDGTREVRLVAPGGRETRLTAFIQSGSRRMIDPAQAFAR
ncbi:hypothetical protein [Thermaurantiacus sp.]